MNKSAIIAIVVFVALAAAAATTLRERPQRGITHVSFASIDPAKVDRIVVKGAQPIELTRDGDDWKTGNQRADAAAVGRLLDSVKRVDSGDVVTTNASRFAEFEVDDEKGTPVETYSGGAKTAEFVVGAATAGGSNVRVGDTVYMVKRVAKGQFARERSAWLDRKLFADAPDSVTRVEVKLAGQQPYVLVKDGADWKPEDASALPAKFRFDKNAARGLVSALIAAQAKDVLEQDPGDATTGLNDGADLLVFRAGEGEPRKLGIGAKQDDGSVYARASTRTELLTLPDHLAKSLRKPLLEMRDLTLMSVDANTAKRLEIVKDKERLVLEKDGETWKVAESTKEQPKDFVFDPMTVTRRIAAIGSARGVAAAGEGTSAKDAGLDEPAASATVTLADGTVATLAFGKDTKAGETAGVFARGNAGGEIYVVNEFTRNNVLGSIETFAKREDTGSGLANIDPKALQNLPPEVRDSLLKQIQQKKQQDEMMRKLMEKQAQGAAPK